ncbi:MAG: lipoyl synthase [bacterium]
MGFIGKNDTFSSVMRKIPDYKKKGLATAGAMKYMTDILHRYNLNTVCQEARCPNKSECFSAGVSTIMILGDVCTRNCAFCGISKGDVKPVDDSEPERVGLAVRDMNLDYVVITSVTRDDLSDGGAEHFAKTIERVRHYAPATLIEALIPDFKGDISALKKVISVKPFCISHNIETVRRLYTEIRPMADYDRSINILKKIKEFSNEIITKSGFMLGLGETESEVLTLMRDILNTGVRRLVIGQYLRPSSKNTPVKKYLTKYDYIMWGDVARNIGFDFVLSEPLARTSYHTALQ